MKQRKPSKHGAKYSGLIDSIFSFSQHVRYAEVFSHNVESVAGGMKPGVRSLEPDSQAEQINEATARYAILLSSQPRFFGKFEYLYATLVRFNLFILPLDRRTILLVTTDPPLGLDFLPQLKMLVRRGKS